LAWRIELTGSTKKQLRKCGHAEAKRIRDFLRHIESLDDPRRIGKGLKGQLSELWRYRVGDYRVVCEIRGTTLVVLVARIGHRKEVYK
jgi:mRNA interferase RelE/StbE